MAEISDTTALAKFDVIEFAKGIMSEIDQIRSFDELVDENTGENFRVPAESRINTFFRLVGLPMFVIIKNKEQKSNTTDPIERHLSPGWDKGKFHDTIIKNSETFGDRKLSKLLAIREKKLSEIESSIGSPDTNKKMKLALNTAMSLIADAPDKNRAYLGTTIVDKKNQKTRREAFKMLTPLVTSYRIIRPKENEVARPFVSKEDRKINNTTELKVPFIEIVARFRFITAENAGGSTENEKQEAQIQSLGSKLSEEDYKKLISLFESLKAADLLERYVLNKLFASIGQLANKWVELLKKQERLLQQNIFTISINTISSKSNPFGKRASVSTNIELNKDTPQGRRLEKLRKMAAKEEAFLSLLPSDDITDSIEPKTAITKNTSLGALINDFVKLVNHDLEQIRKEIKSVESSVKNNIKEVDKLRLELDMMTGEFSGLSMLDVIAVITGLFLIQKEHLLALLDKEAINDMKNQGSSFESAITSFGEPTIEKTKEAIEELENAVNLVFSTVNILVDSTINRKKRTPRLKRNNKRERKERIKHQSFSERSADNAETE
jgi:hypothetical protein